MRNVDGLPARKVIAQVEQEVELTEHEKGYYDNRPNIRRFEKIVRFLTIGPVKAGWMVKNKGEWSITQDGIEAYHRIQDPANFMREARRLYRAWKRDQHTDEDEQDEVDTESESITTLEEAEEGSWTEISSHLSRINPYDFQELVAGLLRAMNYHVSWVAPPGPDRGVDIIAHRDPLGIERGRIKVQVKRRADKIPVTEVRSFLAVLGDEDVGIFVTTAGFTSEAEAEARSQERRRVVLLDSKRLFDLWVENYDRIDEQHRRLMPLRPVYYLDVSD